MILLLEWNRHDPAVIVEQRHDPAVRVEQRDMILLLLWIRRT